MKRSEINNLIKKAETFFNKNNFFLPEWAHWAPDKWKEYDPARSEIINNKLGWDITDFGSNDFDSRGLLLFTIRNGNPEKDNKTYAEKIMLVQEGQETPMHFHWHKMEDIINRGGGNLIIKLYTSTVDEKLSDAAFQISVDGISKELQAGDCITLHPGQSICLTPKLYHSFWGEQHKGSVMVGEVSMVNDDTTDNCFLEPTGRFPEIEEDENPHRMLANEYLLK